ncbi:UDP-glucose/GDP-mannose dehydrogenase family protein [Mesorhizobium sp. Cs1299R1N1]|uniref:UDP-glucose 6-dehydrogenase n=1 Tax=Mesorhizobium salmacidum TaxID=3015171 RepID=A0ABU8KUI0_9HYPH|nr:MULTISPECIES: UDP-glucose/GDP-mannose dehydrogenase family protein [unclassified Mesorhizobium]TPK49578.1 UDP-glucose/GDP-mannose dehydrogenase family protein [Mesorhizobium sp. B2-5-4]TPL90903.1 UDP-glucose/GDP-mannose dehydrogenase family protein [Mesorhizobium sp. B2-3-13]TPM11256.1 UDP-glucose/GDP-mannose dehydrogenase family protein [Mesorhizobium sp. B2-3-11]
MKVSIFGLGYVGTVCAACLAERGHDVIGCDVSEAKVDLINSGRSPIIEKDVGELVAANVASGRLKASSSTEEAVMNSDLSLLCVGTPSRPNGSLDLSAVQAVSRQIGSSLSRKADYHSVVVRSTVLPGTLSDIVIPALQATASRKLGETFGVASNPEFMREGSAVADFNNPAKTVIGVDDEITRDRLLELYAGLPGRVVVTEPRLAELVKYTDNTWHALKVAFGNEIGNICKAAGVDSHELMEVFFADTKLNISNAYLLPGFAFGGSCLPKDVRAINAYAIQNDVEAPLLKSLLPSNKQQVERALDRLLSYGKRKIGFLGFSFKAGTDDLRESPYLELIERLVGKGCDIRIFDPNVSLAKLMGANKTYLMNAIPHVTQLMVPSLDEMVMHSDVVVATSRSPEYETVVDKMNADQTLLDMARLPNTNRFAGTYDGINW